MISQAGPENPWLQKHCGSFPSYKQAPRPLQVELHFFSKMLKKSIKLLLQEYTIIQEFSFRRILMNKQTTIREALIM